MIVTDAERISKWVCEKAGGSYSNQQAIGLERNGNLIAGATYCDYTVSSVVMAVRIDNKFGLKEFFWFAFYYAFEQLKVKNVRGIVSINNFKAQRLNEKLGFKSEAILRDYFPEADAIIYVMRRDECRFLKGKYATNID